MSFATLKAGLIKRLDEGDRGDRGWFLITRVHLSASRLQSIASYLYDAGAADPLTLTSAHYDALGELLDIENENPRQTINRHYFLAMQTPLQLIERTVPSSWNEIVLTSAGIQLATSSNSVAVFEQVLKQIRFCREPWFSADRAGEYSEFDIHPYEAILSVMEQSEGYVDLDEFDLFVSRIRAAGEVNQVIANIREFRGLNENQKAELRKEVEDRVPAGKGNDPRKPYNNWRDMARHTFSLFSLGQSAYRDGNELLLAETLAASAAAAPATAPAAEAKAGAASTTQQPPSSATPAKAAAKATRSKTLLRIPEVEAPPELLTPPHANQANSGTDAELLVGKILAADGWQVVYYNQRRGYGFDLWAKKGSSALVIEVKSFLDAASTVTITQLEHEAATHHKDNFLLVIVENADKDTPLIYVVQNPIAAVKFTARNTSQFTAPRSDWEPKASKSLPSA
ncbi:protein NO VEIN domain-containing protein [Bradyrhizobium sp. SZCCHNR2028]|uniref:protein NO VEIN domain-containing protein n=1 Tax=Bradyrhizobium sp. SZCCHNR2028 TaxID=3057382 RepID=UPI0028E74B43|nr:DUF3883 domain-containing protein [Bradyrhizobium sp. SZCCHNR2028]